MKVGVDAMSYRREQCVIGSSRYMTAVSRLSFRPRLWIFKHETNSYVSPAKLFIAQF
jgi:hypothetical protein